MMNARRFLVFGSPLTVIGFDIDPNAMTITMPPDALRISLPLSMLLLTPATVVPSKIFNASLAGLIGH